MLFFFSRRLHQFPTIKNYSKNCAFEQANVQCPPSDTTPGGSCGWPDPTPWINLFKLNLPTVYLNKIKTAALFFFMVFVFLETLVGPEVLEFPFSSEDLEKAETPRNKNDGWRGLFKIRCCSTYWTNVSSFFFSFYFPRLPPSPG